MTEQDYADWHARAENLLGSLRDFPAIEFMRHQEAKHPEHGKIGSLMWSAQCETDDWKG